MSEHVRSGLRYRFTMGTTATSLTTAVRAHVAPIFAASRPDSLLLRSRAPVWLIVAGRMARTVLKRRAVPVPPPPPDRSGKWPAVVGATVHVGCMRSSSSGVPLFWSPSRRPGGRRRVPSPISLGCADAIVPVRPCPTFACFSPPPGNPACMGTGG
jgi:hypothetical protein